MKFHGVLYTFYISALKSLSKSQHNIAKEVNSSTVLKRTEKEKEKKIENGNGMLCIYSFNWLNLQG